MYLCLAKRKGRCISCCLVRLIPSLYDPRWKVGCLKMISIIVRTYNEEEYISALILAIHSQNYSGEVEVIVVDSGSVDKTVELASVHKNVFVYSIPKESFSYGYALNYGLRQARGSIAVSISAHCLPVDNNWLAELISPLSDLSVGVVYGRQIGTPISRVSETRIFKKTFPKHQKKIDRVFNHNANSAFRMDVWRQCQFDEKLIGLEDQDYALKISKNKLKCVYVPQACVLHFHRETNEKVFNRYYRETVSLIKLEPEKKSPTIKLMLSLIKNVLGDFILAIKRRQFMKLFKDILGYRFSQYFAIYIANDGVKSYGVKFLIQSWFVMKISKGASNLARFKKDKILRRVFEQ